MGFPKRMDSLGIYLSVPFCRSKCSYCNFASGVYPAAFHQPYIERLCAEVAGTRRLWSQWDAVLPQRIDSIYLGGGTPSVLPPDGLRRLFDRLRQEFQVAPSAEITVECAPGQLDDGALEAMAGCGVNRISFGVQSLVDREAASVGRRHTREMVARDLERVRSAGIHNVSIDLIAGLPHQTGASWRESLDALAAMRVTHASIYMLEVDEDSRLGRELLSGGSRYHALTVPQDDLAADLYEMAIAALQKQGLAQYEISNFARPGSGSRHNQKYWRRQPYLGFGLDAHSMLRTNDGCALRFRTTDRLDEFLRDAEVLDVRRLSRAEELEEAWFLGLRLCAGIAWNELGKEFGRASVDAFLPVVEELCDLGLLLNAEGNVRLSRQGILFSNDVFARFLDRPASGEADAIVRDEGLISHAV